ncbi:MAG: hypothetical protein H0V83_14410 [Rubrobacter sp.]|nr:hypothetical protein [Rubrobacter sp.]
MSRRAAAWLAWPLCALSLALTVLSLLLLNLNLSHPGTHIYAPWLDNTLTAMSYAPVGALIASRHPENPVGWLLCLFGLVISISHFCAEYAIYALLAQPYSLPAGQAMAWIVSWLLSIINGLTVFLLLLFPTGGLPSRRWRWLAWLTAAIVVVGVISSAFSSGALMGVLGPIQNPLGIEGFSGVYKVVLVIVFPLLSVAAVFTLFVRLRWSAGVERQQVKWFAYAAAANITGIILAYVIPGVMVTPLWFEWLGFALNIATIPAIPIAIGIAILRHRLYDIDIVINRTLVYGALSVMLVLVYFGGVVGLQRLLSPLMGDSYQLATVASTLAIAALFNPLRRRVQAFVDRRFYRSKYDAAKTLSAFSARLRNETDLTTLSDDLVEVVKETMQPEHTSLWLRPDTSSRDHRAN